MKEKSIVLIIPFFGPLPWYFNYFLQTCKYNPTIDWVIISDDTTSKKELPKNVFIRYMTFDSLIRQVESTLDMTVCLNKPYKLCDFRPAYGLIFEDIAKGYDFWGHTDMDVIYGDIRSFITDEMMEHYDVISMRHDYVVGCLSIFKNDRKVNTLYQQSADHKKVFTNPKHFCFDETNWCYPNLFAGEVFDEMDNEIESMTHLVRRLTQEGYIKSYFDFHVIEGLPGKMKWEKGKLTYNKKFEAVLYHLIKMKNIFKPKDLDKPIPDAFYISPSRIYV